MHIDLLIVGRTQTIIGMNVAQAFVEHGTGGARRDCRAQR
jgi:hypothetical protein